jgi:hypothetical protein
MAARNQDVTIVAKEWTPLTDGAVSSARLHNKTGALVTVQASSSGAPTGEGGLSGGIDIEYLGILPATLAVEDLFPGVGSSAVLYGWCHVGGKVSVSHA